MPVALCQNFYVAVGGNGNGTIVESNAQMQINNAIAAANAGDVIYLQPGTYDINAPIYMKSGISLCGSGSDKTVLKASLSDFSTKGAAMIYLSGVSGAQISNLKINGGEPSLSYQHANGGHDYENAIKLDGGSSDCVIHDIYFTALDGDGVRGGRTTSNISVYNCQFLCSGHDGVQVWYGKNWHITNCTADLFINSGVRLANTINSEINNCFFYCDTGSGFVGIELEDNVDGANIHNNTFQSIHNGYGIGIATVHAYGTANIWGNSFSDCPGGAMSLHGITVNTDQNSISSSGSGIIDSDISDNEGYPDATPADELWKTLDKLVWYEVSESQADLVLTNEMLNSSASDVRLAQSLANGSADEKAYAQKLLKESQIKEQYAQAMFNLSISNLDAARESVKNIMSQNANPVESREEPYANCTNYSNGSANHSNGSANYTTNSTQTKNAILQMTATLENSNTQLQFNYAENINDGRGITFGCIGFCTGTYDGNILIHYYTTLNSNNSLSKYIPALDAIDEGPHYSAGGDGNTDTTGLDGFIQDVQNNNDPLFKTAQLYELDQMYWNPAQAEFNALGGKYPLTQALLYDASVREGPDIMRSLVAQAEARSSTDELNFDQNFINAYSAAVKQENLGDTDRLAGFQQLLNSGNYNLTTPFTFTAYGDQFTITGDL